MAEFGFTEPEAGSDVSQIKTRAIRDGDDYVGKLCPIDNKGGEP